MTAEYDAPGNDITHLENASFASCKTECNNRTDCKAFNFQSVNYPDKLGVCWIKNNASNKGPAQGWTFFERK